MMMTLRVVLCIPALDVKYAEKNTGMGAVLNAVLVLGKTMQMIAKKDSD
jgi:hypothetical protein